MEVEAGEPFHVNCISPTSKPEPLISIFLNGKRISDSVTTVRKLQNKTVETIASTLFIPRLFVYCDIVK